MYNIQEQGLGFREPNPLAHVLWHDVRCVWKTCSSSVALPFIPYRRVFRVRTITVRYSVNIGRSPFNKNSGFGNYHLRAQWNGTFRLHRPDPSNSAFGHCSCKKDAKERHWGQQFCQMERDISEIFRPEWANRSKWTKLRGGPQCSGQTEPRLSGPFDF